MTRGKQEGTKPVEYKEEEKKQVAIVKIDDHISGILPISKASSSLLSTSQMQKKSTLVNNFC